MKTLRRPRRTTLRAATLLAASALLAVPALAACGDDDNGSDDAGTSVSAPDGAFPGNAAAGSTIKIGLINNEGGQAISAPENRQAAEAAAQYANEHLNGMGGHKIELVICKQAEEPTSARDCANRMVEQKVSAVVITTTGLGDVMVPIIAGAKIPYVATAGQSTQELTNPYSFMWSGGFPSALESMAAYAKTNGFKNVTAFTIDVPAAVNGLKMMGTPYFQAAGVTLNIVAIPPGTPDATPQVSAGISGDPEAVVIVGETTSCTSTLKALGTVGYQGQKLGIQACATPNVVSAVGDSINGTKIFTAAQTTGDDDEARLYHAVVDKYRPGTDTSGYAYVGYQGVLGLVRATTDLGEDTSPEAVATAIRSAKDVVLPAGGGLTFTCDGTANPMLKSVCSSGSILAVIEDGKLSGGQVAPK